MAANLYRLDFADGKSYIGVTKWTPARRFEDHRANAEKRCKGSLIADAWRRLGAPTLVFLAIVEDHMRDQTEIAAIKAYGTLRPNGYNMHHGGPSAPTQVAEIAAKHSDFMKGKQYRKGKPTSEETKELIRKIRTGSKHKPESIEKMRGQRNAAGKRTPEQAERIAAGARLGWARRKELAARQVVRGTGR